MIDPDCAYTKYTINTFPDDRTEVWTETNDDGDTGYPGVFAQWCETYPSLAQALKHTGKSRQGVGHQVLVYLDGEKV